MQRRADRPGKNNDSRPLLHSSQMSGYRLLNACDWMERVRDAAGELSNGKCSELDSPPAITIFANIYIKLSLAGFRSSAAKGRVPTFAARVVALTSLREPSSLSIFRCVISTCELRNARAGVTWRNDVKWEAGRRSVQKSGCRLCALAIGGGESGQGLRTVQLRRARVGSAWQRLSDAKVGTLTFASLVAAATSL